MNDDRQLMPDHQRLERLFVTGVLILLFLAVVVRLLGFLIVFNYTTLQMDFSSFYIAGKSVSQGLSPYVNYVESDPGLWDGVTGYTHSRFLYPPLAARPFQLLAWMPYHTAKFIWILSSLIALGAAMVVSFRLAGLRESMRNLLGVGTIVALAYPTLALLERGQVDGFVLLLILSALIVMKKGTRSSLAAGGLLALATLMKLNCIFLLPFLLLRRRWHAALGFVAGGLLLFGLSLAIDGPDAISDYAFTQLPRISEYGEGGPPELGLPRESFTEALRGMGAGFSQTADVPLRDQRVPRADWRRESHPFGGRAHGYLARTVRYRAGAALAVRRADLSVATQIRTARRRRRPSRRTRLLAARHGHRAVLRPRDLGHDDRLAPAAVRVPSDAVQGAGRQG